MEKNVRYSFWIGVKPEPKLRPRLARSGHCFTPGKTVKYENAVKLLVRQKLGAGFKPADFAVHLSLDFYFKRPKSAPKARISHTVKPDLDNLSKAVKDALNGVAWLDDSQVVSLQATKQYVAEDQHEGFLFQMWSC